MNERGKQAIAAVKEHFANTPSSRADSLREFAALVNDAATDDTTPDTNDIAETAPVKGLSDVALLAAISKGGLSVQTAKSFTHILQDVALQRFEATDDEMDEAMSGGDGDAARLHDMEAVRAAIQGLLGAA